MPKNYIYYYEKGFQNCLRATLISSFFFFLVAFNMNKLKGKNTIYGKLALISTILSILAYKVSMITRVVMYFDIFMIIAIPTIFIKMNRGLKKKLLFLIMLTIYLLRYYSFFTNPLWESFVKYKTILGR
jgi:transmembrane protein EpsG